jgi:hypothetical protein
MSFFFSLHIPNPAFRINGFHPLIHSLKIKSTAEARRRENDFLNLDDALGVLRGSSMKPGFYGIVIL